VRDFFEARKKKFNSRVVEKVFESIKSRSNTWERQKEEMLQWLSKCGKN
jgi:hypothetical protein